MEHFLTICIIYILNNLIFSVFFPSNNLLFANYSLVELKDLLFEANNILLIIYWCSVDVYFLLSYIMNALYTGIISSWNPLWILDYNHFFWWIFFYIHKLIVNTILSVTSIILSSIHLFYKIHSMNKSEEY